MNNIDVVAEREGRQNVTRSARNNQLCSGCRKDKQVCKKSDDPAICVRCKQKGRTCDGQHLKHAMQVSKPSITQLVTLLLRESRLSDLELYSVMFRPAEIVEKTRHASQGTSSSTLNGILRPKYGLLARQCSALGASGEILNGVCSETMKWYHSNAAPRDYRPKANVENLLTAIKDNLKQLRKPASIRGELVPPSINFAGTFDELIGAYRAISIEVNDVLEQIFELVESEHPGSGIQFSEGFPPSHIAYMAGDKWIAFRFWEHSPLGVDILGRTMEILVTEQNDYEILRSMNNHPVANRLSISHRDARGLTALEITTILGFQECLDYHLSQQEPVVGRGREKTNWPPQALHLFELALAACFEKNADTLITHGYARFDYVQYFRAAIELRRPGLVARLKKSLFEQCSSRPRTLDQLADYADCEADRIREESEQVWNFWRIHNESKEWLERLEKLRQQRESLMYLANSLRQRSLNPSSGQAAVSSMMLAIPFNTNLSRRGSSNGSQIMEWSFTN